MMITGHIHGCAYKISRAPSGVLLIHYCYFMSDVSYSSQTTEFAPNSSS